MEKPTWNIDEWIDSHNWEDPNDVYNVFQTVKSGLAQNNELHGEEISYDQFIIKQMVGHKYGVILYDEFSQTALFLPDIKDSKKFIKKLTDKICPEEDIESWYGFINVIQED